MTTKNIYERVAEEYHTTPEEVKQEMQIAIRATGIEMDPEAFIKLVAKSVMKEAEQGRGEG